MIDRMVSWAGADVPAMDSILMKLSLGKGQILAFLLLSFLGLVLLTFVIYRIMWMRLQKIIAENEKDRKASSGVQAVSETGETTDASGMDRPREKAGAKAVDTVEK